MKESAEPLNLTTRPKQFIKMIIKKGIEIIKIIMDTGRKIINMIIMKKSDTDDEGGLISPSSCDLVSEDRANLPTIYSISMGEINDRLGVCIIVEEEHATFVSSLLPASRTVEPVVNHTTLLANKTRMSVEFPSNDTASISECLMRLITNSKQIEFLRIVNFVNLEIIMRKIRRTEIGTIELFHTLKEGRRIKRNTLTHIIERHSTYQVFIHDEKFHENVIEDLLHNLPESVKSFVFFGPNDSLANFSKDRWKAIAQDLVDNRGLRKVSIFESQERYDVGIRFCDYREPIMQFMTTFACYFECSCYICMVNI